MKEHTGLVLLVLVSCCIFYLALEGAYCLARGAKPGVSLSYTFYAERLAPRQRIEALADYLQSRREIEERHAALLENRIVLGNTPYDDLATAEARVTLDDPETGLRFKPNLTVRSSHLRSRIFKALDPVSYSYIVSPGSEPELPIRDFLERYRFREVSWSTDANGFRTTLPLVDSDRVIALIGSSPCVGLFLEDDETLASILQRRQRTLRFVNACVNTTWVEDHAAMTRELVSMFSDRLDGAVYTLNQKNYETVEAALGALDGISDLLDGVGAEYRVFVYFHYIYETMPDIMRKRRDLGELFSDKARILERARERGFFVVDLYDVVAEYREEQGSLFAGMALYVDHGHLSRRGNQVLADHIPPVPEGAP